MNNDPQIYGRDDTILALNDAIENLGDHTTGGVFVRYRKALTALRDSLAARPIVGEVEGKPVRVGDTVISVEASESLMVTSDGMAMTSDGSIYRLKECRLPTAADFGGKQ